MNNDPIYVTRPYLPPLSELTPYLDDIWRTRNLTNGARFHQELERALGEFLGIEYISLFSNATIALITALQSLDITGEVITTPYSFVATSHSLKWNGIKPIFVDIEPHTLNINARLIEEAITENTSAIMPVHCYGAPCNVDEINRIANKYNLKVIYDAAHAFGVSDQGGSILRHGDLSVLSFHATKVFNTFEGGAVISGSEAAKTRIDRLKNFGFVDETTVVETGINGKMSEFNAALGIVQLKHIDKIIEARGVVDAHYRKLLNGVAGIRCLPFEWTGKHNYSYFPILISGQFKLDRDQVYAKLKANGVSARRYFYPLISDFPMYSEGVGNASSGFPVAQKAAEQILCLPIYPELTLEKVQNIVSLILE
jgi:dTDP-4-amino-4,6-dideoxygalactose transaminase